jgi:long-chain acyl-CoA synthetase
MSYTAESNSGEIWIRGPTVFQAYYKMPEKTREDLDEQGWFHTGDIGRWTSQGTLCIIDRKKNIFKLSNGEYVAPEFLEGVYQESAFVSQIWVTGDSTWPFLLAVISVRHDHVLQWAAECSLTTQSVDELCEIELIRQKVIDDLKKVAKDHQLKSYEIIADVILVAQEWTVNNCLTTPTMKLRRPLLSKLYDTKLNAIAKRHV